MYLKELEIFGFKSFPKKVTLKLESGITVIVGPNGCGKSNIIDAIRWALGEQSAKSLRSTKMEDVICNGTEKNPPLNYAEVTLTFSNEDRALDIDFGEVSITRKLFRSGESEYYLNQSLVRLKDIQELLSSIGLGEGSYSFVAQGTIENILTYKPEEKRVIFDEAAGILQFKDKKREALRKLQDTDNNIIRLEDIITEVKRQRDSLQRQVQRARRYQEIKNQLNEVERKIAILKLRDVSQKKDSLCSQLDNLTSEEEEKDKLHKSILSQINEKDRELENLKKTSQNLNAQVITANSEISSLTHTIEVNKQRVTEFKQRLENIKTNHSLFLQRRLEQQERIDFLKQELASMDGVREDKKKTITYATQTIESKTNENKEKNHFIKTENSKILSLEEKKVGILNSLIDAQAQLNTFSARKRRLLMEVAKSESEFGEFQARFSVLHDNIKNIEKEVNSFRDNYQQVFISINNFEQTLDKLSQAKVEKEKQILLLTSQLEFVRDLKVRYEDFPETQEVTIVLKKDLIALPSIIVARIDENLEQNEVEGNFRIKTQAKVISQGAQELGRKIERVGGELDKITLQIQKEKENNLAARERKKELSQALQDKEKEFFRLKETENSFRENLTRLNEEKELVQLELKETEEELGSLNVKEKELKNNLSQEESHLSDVQESIKQAQVIIRKNEEDIKNLEIDVSRLNAELSSLEEEKKTKSETLSIFKRDSESIQSQINSFEQENLDMDNKIRSCLEENENLVVQIQAKSKDIQESKLRLEEYKQKQDDCILEQKNLSSRLEQLQAEIDQIRQNIYDKKLEVQNLEFQETRVLTDLRQVYGVELNLEEVSLSSIEETSEFLTKEEQDLQRKLKYLGTVNLGALEEYEELNQRFEFLDRQREDLFTSKATLKKAIAKINKISREMFMEVFMKIQDEFKKMFRFLFRGGKANIFLLDEENVLESGIEIAVQPPEKKLQNVTLLSGGEKSLTATALIFAIFKVKPSPICILDEIDAPLDEANVDRFNHLLSEFAKRSQFILISHNKKTISKADVMYGVTMQESGVSNIVSVKFSEFQETPLRSATSSS